MAPSADIEGVVRAGLCAGCGLCESMAGKDSVEMVLTDAGRLRPRVKRPLDVAVNAGVMAVCPGKTLIGPSAGQLAGSATAFMHPIFGPLRTWFRGWAADPSQRWRSAAGGALTVLAQFLLETGRVQKVLHVRASSVDPTQTEALISGSAEEAASGCQSRYGPAAPLVHVHRLLDEGVIFAVVAKPCDISAVRALGKIDGRVAHQIPYLLTLFCGGLPTRATHVNIAAHHGVKEDDIGLCRHRGHGWPGLYTIRRKSDGKEFGTTYNETWRWAGNPNAGIAKWDMQWRCKICPDAIGEVADVVCPDGWLYDPVLKKYTYVDGDNPGQNLVLARTAVGQQLVADCAASGKLVLAPLEISELEEMHPDHYPRKCSWPVRLLAMWLFGQPVRLSVASYRPWTAFFAGGLRGNWSAFWGTLARLHQGAHKEPLA